MVKNNELSRGDRLKRIAAGTTLAALGVLGLSACGDTASADKAPAPAASASATPGASETTTTTSPAPSETATVQAVEAPGKSPELQSLAAKVTPEKLRTMSPEELKSALSVHYDALDKADPIQSYLQHYAVLVEAADKSGMTHEDWTAAVPDPNSMDVDAYYAYVNQKYADVFAPQLWGTNEGNYKFYDGLHQNYLNATGGFAGYKGTPEGYDLRVELDPSTVKIIDEGDGKTDAFTVEAGFKYKEIYNKEAVQQAMGAAAEPLNDTITMVFHDVAVADDGVIRPTTVENVTK